MIPDRAPIVFLNREQATLAHILDEFTGRYPNPETVESARSKLEQLFRYSGRQRPGQLTERDVVTWATSGNPANNTVYCRLSTTRTFLKWCLREGYVDTNVTEHLSDPDSPLKTYRRTYGKVQAKNPGRWLTRDEAYGQLVASSQDGTLPGLRDELVLRLGLIGMRVAEIRRLTIRDVAQLPRITWTGKGHKPRRAMAETALVTAIDLYLTAYAQHVPHLTDTMPLVCRQLRGAATHGTARLAWGEAISSSSTLFRIIGQRAAQANLGHVAPHDLRRTTAGILHRATDEHGAHHFDLLDIQKVLGHSDPATTMRSYLEPMETDVLDRAALFRD